MALELGSILGAAANLSTAASKPKSLKAFLKNVNKYGLQVTNNFEVNFSGITGTTFFVKSIDFGGVRQNFTQLHYDGREINIPINYEYQHEGNMTVLNDAQGYIYAAVVQFIASQASSKLVNSGYTMTVKCLTGDKQYKGALITLRGVYLDTVSGLSFDYNGGDVSTFTVGYKYIDFTYTPGALQKAAGVVGAITSLL